MNSSVLIYDGDHIGRPKVSAARARVVRVTPVEPDANMLIEVDGETPGRLPATWTLLPKAIHYRG